MRRLYGIPSNRIELIPLGTDTELFRRDSGRREISRKELNISEKTFLCIYTGKFIKEKGIDILIEAMFLLEKKYTDVHLLLI
jgi:glycosyltransferase involved in cell wall biosynthesis